MPLAFHSLSHGRIAFGFFNIESDMLLLEHYFFFAGEFCEQISSLAKRRERGAYETPWRVYEMAERQQIGDLMGAIHGIRFTGFIGDLYRRFPFPADPAGFKQKPDGFRTRAVVEDMIRKYAGEPTEIRFSLDRGETEVGIGAYRFDRDVFQDLILYVWEGGYPRWMDGVRPDYVAAMKEAIMGQGRGIFEGIKFVGGAGSDGGGVVGPGPQQ